MLDGRRVRAVDHVSLALAPGELLGLAGESGCGKSTTAGAILQILREPARISGGRILFRGRDLATLSRRELRRYRWRNVSMVFQSAMSALNPVLRVGDQFVDMMQAHERIRRRDALSRAGDLLELVGIERRRVRAYPHELSGGMRQRVMIAMAIANGPGVILADEPTTALDVTVQAQVLNLLRRHAAETIGAAIVLISHDLDVIARCADRVMVMHAGRAMEPGPVELRPSGRSSIRRAVTERSGRPVVLEVEGLVRHFPLYKGSFPRRKAGTIRAVDGVGFDVREGETLALVGESGSGKTTTLMEILRLSRPQHGRIAVFGHDTAVLRAAQRKALRRDIQVVFQDPYSSLDPRMRVAAILAEPLTTHGVPRSRVSGRVAELLELVGLDSRHARRYPHALSGGEKQRVSIARALALEPRLLLLDEPVSALDASIQADIMAVLEQLKERLGLAYLLVAHDLALVHRIADRIAVMYAGRIVEIGSVDDVYEAPTHPYTRVLLDAEVRR
ncbi:MAG: dipeptide ABC transporter ATP-binding protein [Spirillospora sp.]